MRVCPLYITYKIHFIDISKREREGKSFTQIGLKTIRKPLQNTLSFACFVAPFAMQAATYQARQAVRRVETYAMVHELALDIIHEAETKALQTRVQEHALASRSLQDTVRELRQKQSNLQLKYAEFVKQSEKLRFDLETQLWCAAREIELKKQ